MQEVQKYLKFCYEKKDGFCKNKKKIFLAEQDLQGHCPHTCQSTICTYLVLYIRTEVCNSRVSSLVTLTLEESEEASRLTR